MPATRTETVTVDDGPFDLHLWLPEGAIPSPGLVLVQEIFGVGSYIRDVAERLAALGYGVGAPDMFWRQRRNWEAPHDEAGLTSSMELAGKVQPQQAIADVLASLDRLDALDEVDGNPGVIGFCFGGTMAWAAAVHGHPALAVSYYGSGVPDMLDGIHAVSCPVLLHFGSDDAFMAPDAAQQVERAAAGRPDIEVRLHQGAGHAFDNHEAPMFHQPEAAAAAWKQTEAFLSRHLPVR